ncbi:MAG: TolC family protein [Calditrichaeota bacterium]|nr:MAG: TolC family protein [Calditrichota bacterium]
MQPSGGTMKVLSLVFVLFFVLGFYPVEAQSKKPLTLRDCIQIALENNPNIQTSRNLAKIARYNAKSSLSNILPSVSINASGSRFRRGDATTQADVPITRIDPVTGEPIVIGFRNQEVVNPGFQRNSYSTSLTVSQNIFDGGYWWNSIRRSRVDRMVAEEDVDVRTNEIIRLVAQNFFNLLKQEKLLEVYQLAVQRSSDNLTKTQKMFELGSVAKIDVYRARVNLGNDKISLINQRNVVMQAKQALNISMGYPPNQPLEIESEYHPQYQIPPLEELIQTAMQHQPELVRRELDVHSQRLAVALAKSTFFPNISGFFSYSRDNTELEKIYTDINRNWSVSMGVRFSFNLFNGFQDQVNYQNAKINFKNAQLALEDYKRNLIADVRTLYQNYMDLLEIIEINKANLEAAKEEYRLATERYKLGSATSLDVREAQVNLTDAERIVVSAEYNLIITYAELQEAVGLIQKVFQ